MATSNARNVHLESEQPSALDQHPGVKRYFEQANAAELPVERQQANDQAEGRGSEMVKDDRPQSELKPDDDLARDVDRTAFKGKWEKEQQDARAAYLERYEAQHAGRTTEQNLENEI